MLRDGDFLRVALREVMEGCGVPEQASDVELVEVVRGVVKYGKSEAADRWMAEKKLRAVYDLFACRKLATKAIDLILDNIDKEAEIERLRSKLSASVR